ncbi:MAG: PKD domain-containing protein [Bacteroidales bacterium]|nr:PKD domain-containing protein [Bacteroidales bacterium]
MNNINLAIDIQDLTVGKEVETFIYNHSSHKIKVRIVGNYINSYRTDVRWSFGDGTIVEADEAIHYYSFPGIYNISATLYSTDNQKNIVINKSIIVKEIVPTELTFTLGDDSWNTDLKISKNNKLGEIQISIGNNVVGEPKVSAIRKIEKGKEQSYFDIKDTPYYHLQRYYTFLEENYNTSIDRITSTNCILKPTTFYTPSYINLYGYIEKENNIAKVKAYIIKENNRAKQINFKPYISKEGKRDDNFSITEVESYAKLPKKCTIIGKIGFINIWYKNDFESRNDLIFEIKKDTLKFVNEINNKESYLNIPNLGFTCNTNATNVKTIKALTSNGLYNKSDKNLLFPISVYLEHNFYKDYKVEAIYAQYIKNDKLNEAESYNMFKHINCAPSLKNIQDNKCDICLMGGKDYYNIYNITPKQDYFVIKDNDTDEEVWRHDKLADLDSIVLPSQKSTQENLDEILETYMQHPMYEKATNLKTFLRDILGQKNTFNYIINKSNNFIDDQVNIKTCYIDKLLSIFSMLDEDITQYNIDSFSKINDLKELIRLLSMNYSTIFGNIIENEYDIKITASSKGKNVSDVILSSDAIYCDKNYNIIGMRRDNNILILLKETPFIIVKDDFTFDTHLASFFNIESSEYEDFSDQSEQWLTANKEFIDNVKYVYKLSDYSYKWGWSLNLPEEIKNKSDKSELIDAYYTFYLFNPIKEQVRKYNFIDESTIPTDNNGNQISVEEWNKNFGFTYDCLMKVLISHLSKP